jgi:RNA polymerase sigma-70 factor (ECF subfamily)
MNYSDQKLVDDYLKGNKKSFEILVQRYLKRIYSFVFRYVGNAEEAEDITQEVFVKTWRNLKKFNPRRSRFATLRGRQNKSFKTWIFTIAKNTSFDFLKKKKAIPFSEFSARSETSPFWGGENDFAETLADPSPLPDKLLEQASIGEILNVAINQLAPKYRMVLFLRYNDHFTFREIAETLGEPLNTVKSRHRRAQRIDTDCR